MRVIEPPKPEKQKLLSEEQTSSWLFVVLRLGVVLALIGTVGFLLAFLLRTPLSDAGVRWQDYQTYGLVVVFAGGLLFALAASRFKIDVSLMTFDRLLAIMRNEVYVPPSDREHILRYMKSALSSLDDRWSLYAEINLAGSAHGLQFAMLGPSGVYGLSLAADDPRKRSYVDPGPALVSACAALQARLSEKVTPVLLLARHSSHYQNKLAQLRAFNTEELIAWLESRPDQSAALARETVDRTLREMQASAPGHTVRSSSGG